MIIHPYRKGSESVRHLRDGLRASGVKTYITYSPPSPRSFVVNWGGDETFLDGHPRCLNLPSNISDLRNKTSFFRRTGKDERVVPWTTSRETAERWENVFVRQSVTSSGGRGIIVWQRKAGSELPPAPLYTKRIFATHEYRIHLGRRPNEKEFHVLDTQRKVFKKTEGRLAPTSWAVRSHDNGFIFIRGDKPPERMLSDICAFMADFFPRVNFCALDVLWDADKEKMYILEANTAPGLEGQTVNTYVQFIRSMLK